MRKSYAEASDDDLLRWTPGDPDAFGAFYRRHEDAVLRYMVARVRDGELAADLTAETFAANGFELPDDELTTLIGDSGYLTATLQEA